MNGNAETALRANGLDGHRVLKMAHAIAQSELRTRTHYLGDRYDDLVSHLVETACKAAVRYDHTRSKPGYKFESYLWDIMERRIEDFFRSKGEGFGDRRYGNDNRVVLAGDSIDDEADPDIDFTRLMSSRRVVRYQRAAETVGLDLSEWVLITLDRAANDLQRAA